MADKTKAGVDWNRSDFQNGEAGNDLQEMASRRAAKSGAVGAENGALDASDDPRLLGLIDAWPTLSEGTRDAIVKMARAYDVEDFNDSNALPHGKGVSR